jgi:hypothetical protein
MEDNQQSSAAANPAPPPPPIAPPPAPSPEPAPAATPAAPAPAQASGSFVEMLKRDAVFIAFGIVGATALYYMIYYYRFNLNNGKAFQTSVQNQIDELKIGLSDVNSKNTQTTDPLAQSFT